MQTNTFLMMGMPGSGKGTQAKLLADHLGAQIFSSGNRYREMAGEDSFLGHKIKGVIDSGDLAPSWFSAYLFTEAILKLSLESKVVCEGPARKKPEAERIHEVLTWLTRPYTVIYLDINEQTIRERLAKRAELQGRKDDAASSIDLRLQKYEEDTVPSIEYFRSCGKVTDINGNQTEQEVFAEIQEKLSHLL